MRKIALVALGACLLVTALSPAESKRIKLKDGRIIVGEIVERTDDGIKVKGELAVVFYPMDRIASIEDAKDAKSEYAERKAALDKQDAEGYAKLGQWAMDKKMYQEAVQCFEAALAARKDYERASLLLRQAKAKLEELAGAEDTEPDGASDPGREERTPFDRSQLVQEEDIYRVRLEEVREDERVIVEFRNNAVERFIKQMRGTGDFREQGFTATFRAWPRAKQAKYIIANTDRDDAIKDDILVKGDPAFMREFRGPVWRWISGSCASTSCHGAAKGQGALKLYNFPGRSVSVEYTNFLILDSYWKEGGLRMIRRDAPEQSLLLQYAIPRNLSELRHPKSTKPAFLNREASGYQQTLEWIQSLSGPLHPGYRLKQRPPGVMALPEVLPGLPVGKEPAPTSQPTKKTQTPF